MSKIITLKPFLRLINTEFQDISIIDIFTMPYLSYKCRILSKRMKIKLNALLVSENNLCYNKNNRINSKNKIKFNLLSKSNKNLSKSKINL